MYDAAARQRLTRAMDERFEQLGLTWRQIAAAGGIAYETIRAARKTRRVLPPRTRRAIEAGLQWPRGHVDRILAGETVPDPDETPPTLTAVDGGLPSTLRDDTERELWAITGLPEDERWEYIHMHRGRQAEQQAGQQSRRVR